MIIVNDTGFAGLKLLEPQVFRDNRGYFFESWKRSDFEAAGLPCEFVQDNESLSCYGVIRGLHWQAAPFAQTKLLRVVTGRILDVVVDLRRAEPTYGKHFAVELDGESHRQLYIPKGFAHGFAVLSPQAVVNYKVDAAWNRESERCLLCTEASLGIAWPVPEADRIYSEKDRQGMTWRQFEALSSEEVF